MQKEQAIALIKGRIEDKEYKELIKVLYPKDNSKKFRRLPPQNRNKK